MQFTKPNYNSQYTSLCVLLYEQSASPKVLLFHLFFIASWNFFFKHRLRCVHMPMTIFFALEQIADYRHSRFARSCIRMHLANVLRQSVLCVQGTFIWESIQYLRSANLRPLKMESIPHITIDPVGIKRPSALATICASAPWSSWISLQADIFRVHPELSEDPDRAHPPTFSSCARCVLSLHFLTPA